MLTNKPKLLLACTGVLKKFTNGYRHALTSYKSILLLVRCSVLSIYTADCAD